MSDIAFYNQTFQYQKVRNYFLLFCIIHALLWTLLPLYFRAVLPGDVAEGIAWGMQTQWGYHKHPPFTAWLIAFFAKTGGFAEWPVYLFSQAVALISFFAVWRLALYFVPALQAFFSVLLLEGIVFFNVKTDELTPDTMQTPVWALILLTFYTSLTGKKHWPILGLLCGIAVLTKYSAFLLFGPMLVVLFASREGRAAMKTSGPYIALLIFMLVISPHVWWAYKYGFQAMGYALEAVKEDPHSPTNVLEWILNPFKTLSGILLTLVPVTIMLLAFYKKEKADIQITHFQKFWLLVMGAGPLLFGLLVPLLTGAFVKHRWLTPCYLLTGLMAVVYMKPTETRFIPFLKIFAIVFLCIPLARFGNIYLKPYLRDSSKYHSYYLPVPEITAYVDQLWKEKVGTPLAYVAGESYLTTYLYVYSPDKPKPLMDANFLISPWINREDLRKKGAVFIWYDNQEGFGDVPDYIKKQFPGLVLYPTREFALKTKAETHTLPLGIALLLPE